MGRACPDELCHYTHPVYSPNSGVPLLEEHIWFHWSSTALQCAVLHLASCYSLKIYIILQLYWPVGIPKSKHLTLKNRHDVGTWGTLSVMVGEKARGKKLSEPNSWKMEEELEEIKWPDIFTAFQNIASLIVHQILYCQTWLKMWM